jgi:hypothetical protein
MEKTQATGDHDATSDGRKREMIQFMSTCPRCGQLRSQRKYDRDSLLRLLEGGHPVEAYCEACDDFWPINVKERAGLAIVVLAR